MSGKIKKLCKYSEKWYDQQQYKIIIEAEMASTPEGFTDNIPISPSQSTTLKKLIERKSLRQSLE